MSHSSIYTGRAGTSRFATRLQSVILLSALLVALPLSLPTRVYAADPPQVLACKGNTCLGFCKGLGLSVRQLGPCTSQCENSCSAGDPPPITIKPKYLITGLVYAPPGCTTGGTPSQCGTTNGSSFVDYGQSSSNGIKVTNKDSFQLGVSVTYDHNIASTVTAGGTIGFQDTTTDSTAVNVTKSKTYDLKVPGNGDGVDHGQDLFMVLLRPSVTLKKQGNTILWSFTNGGSPYEVYASELRRPSTMRAPVAAALQAAGFTADDYQMILSQDPFGGTVCTGSAARCGKASMVLAVAGARSAGQIASAPLDPQRFWQTGWSFSYEPTVASPQCNGGVCNCVPVTQSFTNDTLGDTSHEDDGQTTVDLNVDAKVPLAFDLKVDTKMVWTTSATTDNLTESKQTAAVTITCPSTHYTGLTEMAVYWDSRYGSFVFIPYDPASTPLLHKGQVLDSRGHPIAGQLVTMTYGGRTQRTFTAPDGNYTFAAPGGGKALLAGTAKVTTGGVTQSVLLGTAQRAFLKMRR